MARCQQFSIHGDNIVECERTLDLILRSFGGDSCAELANEGSPFAPSVVANLSGLTGLFHFQLLPGFGRWDGDILELVRSRGGRLREAADAVICRVENGQHTPILAIEYCGALPAGNQAWQRSGRAYSFANARVPYFYIAEIGGYELDAGRKRKSERMPNPAVPASYLLLTNQYQTPALPVFVLSPGASSDAARRYGSFVGVDQFLRLLRHAVEHGCMDTTSDHGLAEVALSFVKHLADNRARRDGFSGSEWEAALSDVSNGTSLAVHLSNRPKIPWKKTAYIDGLTSTARELMAAFGDIATGLTSSSLPMCVVPEWDRSTVVALMVRLYPHLEKAFLTWLGGPGPLAVCWVTGFKPRGDDARPDRGLPPLCRTLSGADVDMLTVVYGPASVDTWRSLDNSPRTLAVQNGLWESILACSDAVLADAETMPTSCKPRGYLKSHWSQSPQISADASLSMLGHPLHIGENDVDTVIHLIFARCAQGSVFEGLCNPPGGDWSGISFLSDDRTIERRWLVLPRVTASDAKRPDHVLQVFRASGVPTVVAIESKDKVKAVESNIGPRLARYVDALLDTAPSVVRRPGGEWRHAPTDQRASVNRARIVTAAAAQVRDAQELDALLDRSETDFAIGIAVSASRDSCTCYLRAATAEGRQICSFIAALPALLKNVQILNRG
jgi:hypothetical protein